MKNYVRLTVWLTVISSTLLVGSNSVSAKTALIERQGDQVRVTYRYGDAYKLEAYVPPSRRHHRVLHEHFYYFPNYNSYGYRGNGFRFYPNFRYPVYFR